VAGKAEDDSIYGNRTLCINPRNFIEIGLEGRRGHSMFRVPSIEGARTRARETQREGEGLVLSTEVSQKFFWEIFEKRLAQAGVTRTVSLPFNSGCSASCRAEERRRQALGSFREVFPDVVKNFGEMY
jgi:hypothetical protein